MSKIENITNFLALSSKLATSGLPKQADFTEIANEGYELVVNLAFDVPPDQLPDEAGLVRSLGMEYIHIPVVWQSPQPEDAEYFFDVMDANQDKRIFVHCIANYRVSAFVYLYRILRRGAPEPEARTDLLRIWTPDGVWARFIAQMTGSVP